MQRLRQSCDFMSARGKAQHSCTALEDGSEGSSSVTGRERDQIMLRAKPVINPAEPAGRRQHLKYPIFRAQAMSRTRLDCPGSSHQCELFATVPAEPESTLHPAKWGEVQPLLLDLAVPLGCAHLPLQSHPWAPMSSWPVGSPPGHSSPAQPQELGQGSQRDVFLLWC